MAKYNQFTPLPIKWLKEEIGQGGTYVLMLHCSCADVFYAVFKYCVCSCFM